MKIKLNKIEKIFKQLPQSLAENAFLLFLVLFFFALILGSLILYQYGFLAQEEKRVDLERSLFFDERVFQEILKIWQKRQKTFEEDEFKEFNPFQID